MTLPDATRVYPAHGAGSACGKNLSTDRGRHGRAEGDELRPARGRQATFMELVTEGQPPAPGYFVYDAILNRKDRELLDETEMPTAMTYEQVLEAMTAGAVLVDGRGPRSSPRATCATRSISGSRAATPSSPGRCFPPTSTLCCSPSPARNSRPRTGRPHRFRPGDGYLDRPFEAMFEHRDDVGSPPG